MADAQETKTLARDQKRLTCIISSAVIPLTCECDDDEDRFKHSALILALCK
jgi:hypothetical protein